MKFLILISKVIHKTEENFYENPLSSLRGKLGQILDKHMTYFTNIKIYEHKVRIHIIL